MPMITLEVYEYLMYPPDQPLGRKERHLSALVSQAALLLLNLYGLGLPEGDAHRQQLVSLMGMPEVKRREQIVAEHVVPAIQSARRIGLPIIYAADSAPRLDLGRSRFAEIQRTHLGFDPEELFVEDCNDPHEYHVGEPRLIAYAPAIAPQPGDYYVRKWVYSAFYMTWMDRLLRNLGTRTLICAGFNGDSDLLCTMLEGHWLGYQVVLLRDGFAAVEIPDAEPVIPLNQRLVHYTENCLGYTCASADFIRACERIP